MTNKHLTILCLLAVSLVSNAQIQQGYVKIKGVLQDDGSVKAGKRLEGVTIDIKSINSILSRQQGDFSFNVPSPNYYLLGIKKQGYVLADPEATSRAYNYSVAPLVVVLENIQERLMAIIKAKSKIRRTMNEQLQKKEEEIAALKKSDEEKQTLLQQLYDQQENTDKLIASMANRFVNTDYDQVSEKNRQINALILAGELNKADSLIGTKGNFEQREQEIRKEQETQMAAENLAKQLKEDVTLKINDLAEDYLNKHTIYAAKYQNDSALFFIERRAALDTTNIEWQDKAGMYLYEYIADYSKTMQYYKRILRLSEEQFGKQSAPYGSACMNIGVLYISLGDYDRAIDFLQKAIDIERSQFGEEHASIADCYSNIADFYERTGKLKESLKYSWKALNIFKKVHGELHETVAREYSNLGNTYEESGDYDKAEEYLKKSLDIVNNLKGEHLLLGIRNTSITVGRKASQISSVV